MTHRATPLENQDLAELVGGIVHDAGTLLSEQVDLLRAEVSQQVRHAGEAAASIAAGGGLTAAGGLLSGMMLAHLLHRVTKLPLWACYGAVGGGISAAGIALLLEGKNKIGQVQLTPQTVESFKENAAWLKEQVSP